MAVEIRVRQRVKSTLDISSVKVAIFEGERESVVCARARASDGLQTEQRESQWLHFEEGTNLRHKNSRLVHR